MFLKEKILKHPFRCLFFIFSIIYILSSFVISYITVVNRLESVSEIVLNILNKESKQLQDLFSEVIYTKNFTKDLIKLKFKKLTEKNFILIKIFNSNFDLIIKAEKIDKEIYKTLESFEKKINIKKKFDFFIIKDSLYLVIYKKLSKGFIEAVYKVPDDINENIRASLIQSIKIVSFVLLISFYITFLIVNNFTKTIKKYSFYLLKENILSLQTIGTMIAKRDSETGEHNYRVTYYAVKIAENMPFSIDIQSLIKGAFLHDIGKIAIPDSILLKPQKLTKEEFEIMKTHVIHGYEIIKENDFINDALDVILYHHERYDGKGYLKGLKGEEIPINARIFAIADVFDALTSKRPYKEAYSFEKSMEILKKEKGKHFCPVVFETFEKIAEKIYNDIKGKNSPQLKRILQEIILKYFGQIS